MSLFFCVYLCVCQDEEESKTHSEQLIAFKTIVAGIEWHKLYQLSLACNPYFFHDYKFINILI